MTAFQLKGKYEYKGKNKGYERTYRIYDDEGRLLWSCDVYGQCISAPTAFEHAVDKDESFLMRAKGKILNFTYFLEDSRGSRFATISRKGVGFRWKVLDADNREIARFVDPASNTEAFYRTLLSALPDGYAVISAKQLVARISGEKLSEKIPSGPRNKLGRFVEKFLPPSGLTIRLEPDQLVKIDLKILVAGMILLEVHDITGVNRNA